MNDKDPNKKKSQEYRKKYTGRLANREYPDGSPAPRSKERLICANASSGKAISSVDVVYASEIPEFFYESSGDIVCEGEAVGIEISEPTQVTLVLFEDIYFQSSEPYQKS